MTDQRGDETSMRGSETAGKSFADTGSGSHQPGDEIKDAKPSDAAMAEKAEAVGPPNGGTRAWLQVVGAFFLFFNTWGLMNTFGVYQGYYESGQLFTASASNISWIGSIQVFIILVTGCITGPIFDAGHLRFLLGLGTFGVVFGHMMLSLVHTYWQALLAQAFAIGIGAGCLYVPSVAVLPQYFSTHMVTAMGLAVSGSSLGGIIYPIMFNRLLSSVGFPWAVRIIGFFALAVLTAPLTTIKLLNAPPAKRAIFDKTAFTDLSFAAYMAAGFVGYLGLLVPFFYIPATSTAQNLASQTLSFYLLPMLNAASILGRILPAMLADRIGPLNAIIPTAAATALVAYCGIPVHDFAGMVYIAVFYGFCSGAYIALPPAIFVRLTPPEKRHLIGTRMGMGFTIMGVGGLIGSPVAGAIGTGGNVEGVWIWTGTTLALGSLGFLAVRVMRVGVGLKHVV